MTWNKKAVSLNRAKNFEVYFGLYEFPLLLQRIDHQINTIYEKKI